MARPLPEVTTTCNLSQCGRLVTPSCRPSCQQRKYRPARGQHRDSRVFAAAASTLTESYKEQGSAEQEEQNLEQPSFVWTKHWYPIALVTDLDASAPSAHTLLNIKMVIWQDGNGNWGASQDQCPHRLAPLSEGRLHNGHLACNYHGWEFDVRGTCLNNPQANQKTQESVCNNSRSRAAAYPTKVAQGMLWIWPESGPHAWLESAMASPQVVPEMEESTLAGADAMPGVQTWPVSWDVSLENTMDPSHASWLHDGVAGKWEDARPLTMHLTQDPADPNKGFTVEHNGYSKAQQESNMRITRHFIPPCTARYEYAHGSGRVDYFGIYFVPLAPGLTRTFFKLTSRNAAKPTGILFNLLSRLPPWVSHNVGSNINDQDAIMLHGQDRALKDGKQQWQNYFLATPADRGVTAFRQWLHKRAGGDVGWAGGVTSADLPPARTRQQLLSRWERHTQHCASCKQGMATVDKIRNGLTVASAALLLAALFTTAQYRSAITDSTLLELAGSALLLAAREKLRTFNEGFITRTSKQPVYNFRKK